MDSFFDVVVAVGFDGGLLFRRRRRLLPIVNRLYRLLHLLVVAMMAMMTMSLLISVPLVDFERIMLESDDLLESDDFGGRLGCFDDLLVWGDHNNIPKESESS